MKVSLFVPCFVDSLYPEAAISAVRVLERLGHEVAYSPAVTCCGQPAFNSGYWDEARQVATRVLDAYEKADVVVSVSGSCGAMLKVFFPEMFHETDREESAKQLSGKGWEVSDFLVTQLAGTDGRRGLAHSAPARAGRAKQLGGVVWGFSVFLVSKRGVTDVGARFPHRVTWHDGCHGLREMNV